MEILEKNCSLLLEQVHYIIYSSIDRWLSKITAMSTKNHCISVEILSYGIKVNMNSYDCLTAQYLGAMQIKTIPKKLNKKSKWFY